MRVIDKSVISPDLTLSDSDDFYVDNIHWSSRLKSERPSIVPRSYMQGIAIHAVNYVQFQNIGIRAEQFVLLNEVVLKTGLDPHIFQPMSSLRAESGSYERWLGDFYRMSDSTLEHYGVQDSMYFQELGIVYFVISAMMNPEKMVLDWHLLVEKIGLMTFIRFLTMGASVSQIEEYAKHGIDPALVSSLVESNP
jgi:hypothetical protein